VDHQNRGFSDTVPTVKGETNMNLHRILLLALVLAGALDAGAVLAQSAPAAGKPAITLQMPAIPDPVPVALKPATTAVFVSDMIDPTCANQPKCTGTMVPAVAALLARARKAGVFVVYSTQAANASKWLPPVAPAPGDPFIASQGQDRFYNTDLDKTLKAKGITTVVLTGWKISGSILYTSVGATLRGYTVVVPVDASLAGPDYEEPIGLYQILNQNAANATNQPLKEKTSTLSRTDLISFQ
jgi:nicotinamidase-related amidase